MTRLRAPGLRRRADDTGSLPLAMLLVIIGVGLSAVLSATVTQQLGTTRNETRRTDSLNAARSGIEVVLGQIRTAVASDGSGQGDPTKLPCGPFSGVVDPGTAQTYTVTVHYLTTAPTAGDVTWAAAHRMPCGSGGYLASGTPTYALLAATGRSSAGGAGRTVVATYTLQSKTRENVAGGLVHLYGTSDLCFAAPGIAPAAGSAVTMQTCDPTADAQKFAYTSKLNLVLVSSQAGGSAGMCLDAPPADRAQVVFQPCLTPVAARQQWSLNDRASFEGTTDGITLNRMCFHLTAPGTPGSTIVLHDKSQDPAGLPQYDAACETDYADSRSFNPDAEVGTGRAGPGTEQLVNFKQFGRCLDVTADDPNYGFLVIWPCKQKPSGTIQWNQVWHLPPIATGAVSGTGRIWTTYPNTTTEYCLTSPGSTAVGAYKVTVTPCPSAPTPSTQWTRYGATGVFSTAYRIESEYGITAGGPNFCLAAADQDAPNPDDLWGTGNERTAKAVLNPCTASMLQKWNASPMVLQSSLSDVNEP